MVNVVGAESCRKIIRHPLVGQCRRVQRPPFLYRDEMEEVGGEVPVIYLPGKPPIGFAGARYPPAIGRVFAQLDHQPGLLLLSCLHLLAPKEELVFRGKVAGLLDMTVSSDDPMGCSRTVKASEIRISPRSRCTQALAYCL